MSVNVDAGANQVIKTEIMYISSRQYQNIVKTAIDSIKYYYPSLCFSRCRKNSKL